MAIKVNEFVIQAQVIEEGANETSETTVNALIPPSVKKEIIDECLEKMKDYLAKEKGRS